MATLIGDIQRLSVLDDPNNYRIGSLPSSDEDRPHRVVLTTLPRDNNRNAATACTNLIRSFPQVRCIVVTGIAGGVPSLNRPIRHVRLGDIVVAIDGVIDFGHTRQTDGSSHVRRQLEGISMELIRAAQELQLQALAGQRLWEHWLVQSSEPTADVFARPGDDTDVLYVRGHPVPHPDRSQTRHPEGQPKIHYASIGCADVLLRDEEFRDSLAEEHGFVAVEMESAGVAASASQHNIHWFAVRGVADYCDAGKNDVWHAYASMASAAYVRSMLAVCRPFPTSSGQSAAEPLTLVTEAEWKRLGVLLQQAPDMDPRELWYAAAGDLAPIPPRNLASLKEVFDHLASINADTNGVPPALAFVEEAALRCRGRLRAQLREWNDAWATRLHLTDALLHRRTQRPAETTTNPATPCVVVQIEPDGLDRNRCLVSFWIQRRNGPWQPQLGGDAEDYPLAIVERVVDKIVERAETAWREGDDKVAIEFLLPTVLMYLPVEWWNIDTESDQPLPLGLDFPVVVRSLERMKASNYHRMWRNRWTSLQREPPQHHLYWGRLHETESDPSSWHHRLRIDRTITTVVLSQPPDSSGGRAELSMALRSGVPVILWDRRNDRPASITGIILELTTGDPYELPERMQRLRGEAAIAEPTDRDAHAGRYLALLWDDPNRPINARGAGP